MLKYLIFIRINLYVIDNEIIFSVLERDAILYTNFSASLPALYIYM